MKTKLSITIVIMVAIGVLCGCEKKESASQQTSSQAPAPPLSVCVMKLTKPEYKNNVLASHSADADVFISTRGNFCESPIGKSGYSPYWELPDEWLLVDWKWYDFPYAISTALIDHTWEKYEWKPSADCTWPLTEPHTQENPIAKTIYIGIDDLEAYAKADYGKEMKQLIRLRLIDLTLPTGECLCEMPDKMDSIWNVLLIDISDAIKKGELEKIYNNQN